MTWVCIRYLYSGRCQQFIHLSRILVWKTCLLFCYLRPPSNRSFFKSPIFLFSLQSSYLFVFCLLLSTNGQISTFVMNSCASEGRRSGIHPWLLSLLLGSYYFLKSYQAETQYSSHEPWGSWDTSGVRKIKKKSELQLRTLCAFLCAFFGLPFCVWFFCVPFCVPFCVHPVYLSVCLSV